MADIIQDDLNVNINSITQSVIDIAADYVASKFVLEKVTGTSINMKVSVAFHILDEVVIPGLFTKIVEFGSSIPVVGGFATAVLSEAMSLPYIKVIARIILLLILQKTMGQMDFIELGVILANTYAVNFGAEIKQVKRVLDIEF